MGTACFCDYGDEPWKIYRASRPLARVEHRCSECGGTIEPGARYERVKALSELGWEGFKTCHRCLALRDWLEAVSCCFCWYHDNLLEDASIEIQENNWKPGFRFAATRLYVEIRRAQRQARHRRNGNEK